jgi:hypothetical protein
MCPILSRSGNKNKITVKNDFFGPSTSIFVGRIGYPDVGVGPMAALDEIRADEPSAWFGTDYSKIIDMRMSMLRSRQRENIFSKNSFIDNVQELALASRPTDVEMNFSKTSLQKVSFSFIVQPMGPTADIKKLDIAGNTKIEAGVERIVNDDLRAAEAGMALYGRGADVYKIMTILSSGVLGHEKNRKLVPTRWSITAVDDIITKGLLDEIRTFDSINDFLVFEARYLDNHFVIIIMPGAWEFENFEAWAPGSSWSFNIKKTEMVEEYEPFHGRKSYAEKQAGGYYAARLAAAEYLHNIRRQARVFSIREISEGYVVPLGVWVVRETARNAFKNRKKFTTLAEALGYMKTRLRNNMDEYMKRSVIFRQKRLWDY